MSLLISTSALNIPHIALTNTSVSWFFKNSGRVIISFLSNCSSPCLIDVIRFLAVIDSPVMLIAPEWSTTFSAISSYVISYLLKKFLNAPIVLALDFALEVPVIKSLLSCPNTTPNLSIASSFSLTALILGGLRWGCT